jgi:hypothetical protein
MMTENTHVLCSKSGLSSRQQTEVSAKVCCIIHIQL